MSLIITENDLLDAWATKERELAFYQTQFDALLIKRQAIQREINLTAHIISLLEQEKILNLKRITTPRILQ